MGADGTNYRNFNEVVRLSPQYLWKGSRWGLCCSSLDQMHLLQPLLYLPALSTEPLLHIPHKTYLQRSLGGGAITQRKERPFVHSTEATSKCGTSLEPLYDG